MAVRADDRTALVPLVKTVPLCYPMRDYSTPPFHHSVEPPWEARTMATLSTTTIADAPRQEALSPGHVEPTKHRVSLGNLLEGSLYDFKKKNDLRFTVGSPCCDTEKTTLVRYEEPFCVTFLFRFKM
jgi:hypothetical protein